MRRLRAATSGVDDDDLDWTVVIAVALPVMLLVVWIGRRRVPGRVERTPSAPEHAGQAREASPGSGGDRKTAGLGGSGCSHRRRPALLRPVRSSAQSRRKVLLRMWGGVWRPVNGPSMRGR